MERRVTTPTAHASSVNRKKRNRRKESCNGTDYIDWRSAHRKIACRPLCRFAEAPGGAPELRQVRQDFHHDRGCAGADRQRRASRKGAPEHHRSRPRLPFGRSRPEQIDAFHPVADSRTVRAGVLLYEPRHGTAPAAQPDREGRNPAARLRREQHRGRHPAASGHSRRILHLPDQSGGGHHGFQSHDRTRGRGSGADDRANARNRPQIQHGIRSRAGRTGDSAARKRGLHAAAGNRRQGQDVEVALQLHLPVGQRR